jgi:dynein heavy chain 1
MRCAFDCFDAWMDAKGGGKHNIDPEDIPWTALVTSLGQVFYGGRVDNLFDQRVMMSFLKQIFKPEAFQRDFNLAASPEKLPFLTLPDSHERKDFIKFIDELATHSESPEWLGLPSSAELLIRADAGRETSLRLAKLQDDGDGGGAGAGKSRNEIAAEMITFADLILGQLPESLAAAVDDGTRNKTALERFFERELSVAVSMVKMIRKDLNDLKTVAGGEARSTDRTRAIQASLLKGEVPPIWLKYPIPEITVNAWVTDFVARANQLVDVAAKVMAASKDGIHGMSDPVWMGAFFMPGAFLTATQQTAAKVLESSMEQLQMIVDVVEDEGNPFDEGAPAGSQYLITGVFLEAAAWENGALALTNQMLNRMPTVKITWLVQGSQDVSDRVELPIYLNVTRKQLVTTALLKGPKEIESGTWYQRGTSVQLWRQV